MHVKKSTLKDSNAVRWGVLILLSFVMAANYYFYDALSPLKSTLQDQLGFSSSDYGFLVSSYSIPNVFLLMAVIGGVILDRLGIRITGTTFIGLMAAGSIITAYGSSEIFLNGGPGYELFQQVLPAYTPALKMMTLGFFLFGFGAETSIVVITKTLVKWFKGKELALALGINIGIARLGTALAFNISPALVTDDFWNKPIWFAASLMVISFLGYLIYLLPDIKLDRQEKQDIELLGEDEKFRMNDIVKLITNRSFIYITLLCVTFYAAIFPFLKYAPDLLENKFGFTPKLAGDITSILPYGTVIFTPLFGWFADVKGKSATLMIYGSGLLLISFLSIAFTNLTPYIAMFVLGIAFSLVPAAMWPAVSKIVEENRLGTAYGLMFSVQNLGMWAFPFLIGIVLDKSNPGITPAMIEQGTASYDYTNPILMLSGLGIVGFIFAILLRHDDKTSGYDLEKPNMEFVEADKNQKTGLS